MHHHGNAVNPERMRSTYNAIQHELGHGHAMLYRYSGVEEEEITFIASSFWPVETWASMGDIDKARTCMKEILASLCDRGNVEIFNEMFDVRTLEWRGNLPRFAPRRR
nr:glycoside hydrolase family 15 [Candidatus Pantoea persica]